MILFILTFLMGDLWLQTFKELPSTFFICYLLIITFILIIFFIMIKQLRFAIIPFAFACGFLWCVGYVHAISSWTLKKEWEGKPLRVSGVISSLPNKGKYGTSFEFNLQQIHDTAPKEYLNTLIRLTIPHSIQTAILSDSTLKAGDKWQFRVRLKRIHGVQSKGAFDYEAWGLQKGIRASGQVIASPANKVIAHERFSHLIVKFRQVLQEKIISISSHSKLSPWLMALMIGERNGIAQEDWQVLRNTGTNHLMAIGGLHIGILASFAHFSAAWGWRRFPLFIHIAPSAHIGACAALLMAILYSALSGFLIPTQRASIMLAVFILAVLTNRKISAWNAWSLALFCVLLMNPLSVLSDSFWLSFATIALIIYGMSNRLSPSGIWWSWLRVQWVIGIGLIPFTLLLFQECSLVSFIANSIAIPWLAIAILPFCFLSAVFLILYPPLGALLLFLANSSLNYLWMVLSWFAQLQMSSLQFAIPNFFSFILMLIGFLFFLLPRGMPGRWLGLVWIMPVFLYVPAKPALGEYSLTLLDVGQGLAVVIQTRNHTLVYDTGAKFEGAMDMGESVVLPYLRKMRINKIDQLVISHGDNDHLGGAQALLTAFPHTEVKTSVPDKISSSHVSLCKAQESWQWDEVNFTFLYPWNHDVYLGNDSSCVLLIDNHRHRVLLTGDIEKAAENDLLAHHPENLKSDIIIAPHHGSKTSGLATFIDAVHPKFVLYATGYRNRYHFPHQSVVMAYEKMQAQSFNTVESGTIHFIIPNASPIPAPERYRVTNKKYWFDEAGLLM